jgi:hypothetical protein
MVVNIDKVVFILEQLQLLHPLTAAAPCDAIDVDWFLQVVYARLT